MGITTMSVYDFCRDVAQTCSSQSRMVDEIAFRENCMSSLPSVVGQGFGGPVGRTTNFMVTMAGKNKVNIDSNFNWSKRSVSTRNAMTSFCDEFDPPNNASAVFDPNGETVDETASDLDYGIQIYLSEDGGLRTLLNLATENVPVFGEEGVLNTKPSFDFGKVFANPLIFFKSIQLPRIPVIRAIPRLVPVPR